MAFERSSAAVTLAGGWLRRPARVCVDSAAGGSSSTAVRLPVKFQSLLRVTSSNHDGCTGPGSPSRALEDVSGSPPALLQFSRPSGGVCFRHVKAAQLFSEWAGSG